MLHPTAPGARAAGYRPRHHVRRLILLSPAGFHPVIPALFKPVAMVWGGAVWVMTHIWRQQVGAAGSSSRARPLDGAGMGCCTAAADGAVLGSGRRSRPAKRSCRLLCHGGVELLALHVCAVRSLMRAVPAACWVVVGVVVVVFGCARRSR